jgi:hypothetical protein
MQQTEQHQYPSLQQQQQPDEQQVQQQNAQQPGSLKELAAIAGVDLASQARILRDIEIRGMVKSRREQQHAAAGSSNSTQQGGRSVGKRKASGHQGQQGGKQMRISNMFGKQ